MYFSKRKAPGQFAFYDPLMSAGALQRLTMETKLRGALEREELSLQYQPQFDLQTGLIAGVEALLRWTTPDLGAGAALRVHSDCRGHGHDLSDRRMGDAHGVRPAASLDG